MKSGWERIAFAALPALLAASSPGQAQSTPSLDVAGPAASGYAMPATAVWDLPSETGDIYRIFVSFPAGEPPETGWPVLYVLDGNAMFAGFAEARRIQEFYDVGKTVIVGVGYPTDQAYDSRRLYDFTSTAPPPEPWRTRFAGLRSGGRDHFLRFLTGPLRREIGKRYRIDPDRQSLFGHSLGGLFAIHALYEAPDAFHAVIAASPSLFWHEAQMLRAERDFAKRLKQGKITKVARLLVVAAENEETVLELWDPEAFVRRMEPLSAYGLRLRWKMYEDETHITVPSRAVTDTLRFAFSWP